MVDRIEKFSSKYVDSYPEIVSCSIFVVTLGIWSFRFRESMSPITRWQKFCVQIDVWLIESKFGSKPVDSCPQIVSCSIFLVTLGLWSFRFRESMPPIARWQTLCVQKDLRVMKSKNTDQNTPIHILKSSIAQFSRWRWASEVLGSVGRCRPQVDGKQCVLDGIVVDKLEKRESLSVGCFAPSPVQGAQGPLH